MKSSFEKLKAEADRMVLPEECEENDRAVTFLALEMGVGHYDNLNLLIMSVLFIFVSVAFLAVSSGKISGRNEDDFTVSKEAFFSGELTAELEERYMSDLPIPEQMKAAEERISLLYGFGNTVTTRKNTGNYSGGNTNSQPDTDNNAFERDDSTKEKAVTTKAAVTDKDGNTVTAEKEAETAPGGGTTAVSRPSSTYSTMSTRYEPDETTTTNNDPPFVTTTTTVVTKRTDPTDSQASETEPTDSRASETEPTDSRASETEQSDTKPSDTDPPVTEGPAE